MFAIGFGRHRHLRCVASFAGFAARLVAAWLIASPLVDAQKPSGPIVTVTGGKIQGRAFAETGAVFKGIPYAAPPVGNLRWREPQPVVPWTGLRQAADYGADCISNHAEGSTRMEINHTDPERPSSEDCLFLNLWTPESPLHEKKKPVMIYLHGSELFGGTGTFHPGPNFGSEGSLARHGVILVSINYRPNLLGMMAHPELTKESPHHASGNYIIMDAVAALQWIHDNIAHFGGDPDNVTLFGQSGGATITSFLLTSPLTKGLITRAIIESGAPAQASRYYDKESSLEASGLGAAKLLNAPADDPIKFMRALPVEDIIAASKTIRQNHAYAPYNEGIDGYVITRSPAEVFREHEEPHVPIMIGSTSQDSNQVDGIKFPATPLPPEETKAWVGEALKIFYGKYPDLLARARHIYGLEPGPNEVSTYGPYGDLAYQVGVDLHHRCAVLTTANWHYSVAPTYVYEFTRDIPTYPPVHESELRFVFGFLSTAEVKDDSAHKLQDTIQTYWTNFAKTGNPNGAGLPTWAKYDPATGHAIDFTNNGPVERNNYRSVACGPYIDYMKRQPSPLLVK